MLAELAEIVRLEDVTDLETQQDDDSDDLETILEELFDGGKGETTNHEADTETAYGSAIVGSASGGDLAPLSDDPSKQIHVDVS